MDVAAIARTAEFHSLVIIKGPPIHGHNCLFLNYPAHRELNKVVRLGGAETAEVIISQLSVARPRAQLHALMLALRRDLAEHIARLGQ